MRVLMVSQTYLPYLREGGRPAAVHGLARGLVRRGHQVTVLTSSYERPARGMRRTLDGVEAVYLAALARRRTLTLNPGLPLFCARRLQAFDLVHVHGLYDLLGPAAAWACRRRRLPYLVEPMGMYRPIARSLRAKRLYHRLLGRALVSGAARLVATSELERGQLVAAGVPAERVALRPNGVDLDEFRTLPARGAFRAALGLGEREPLVLFIGRLARVKGLELLVRAWRAVPAGARLVLAGPDDGDGSREAVERLAAESGDLGRSVLLAGPLYGMRKLEALADADLFVLPSESENFGLAAAEAVACGVPVVLTRGCGIAALLADRAALVVPYEEAALAAALGRLLEDSALRERLAAGARAVAAELSWEGPVLQMERIYGEALAG